MNKFKHVHIIGVCGTLMGAFAAYLKRTGIRVTGSDQNVYPPMSDVLKNAGVELFSPYSAENVSKINGKPDLIVVGNVISKGNPEMMAFEAQGFPYVSLPEFMEKHLLPQTQNLVVAGTHGKTTTSSLLAQTLAYLGERDPQWKPSYFIGGVSQSLPHSFHVENGKYFVLEGDEYDTAFWDKVPKFNHYLPDRVILTSVEFDHADIYADLDAVKKAFLGLIERIRPGGLLIACVESENVRDLLDSAAAKKVKVITYGRKPEVPAGVQLDYTLGAICQNSFGGIDFEVVKGGKILDQISIHLPGEHNALNALAVYVQCEQLGLDFAQIKEGLVSFKGVKRRQEERGVVNGVLVIDDFAHHPTAVKETLKALRAKYPGRKLNVVFEPRSATSRRKVFQQDYLNAFGLADETFVAVAFDQSKIPQDQQFSSEELVGGLKEKGKLAHYFQDVEEGVRMLASKSQPNDVVAVLSNGGFGGFIPKLLDALKQ